MPLRNAPSKLKIVTYITGVEKIRAEVFAKAEGLTLSEWVRQAILDKMKADRATELPTAQRAHSPTAKELLQDFIIGDINSPDTDLDNG